MDDAQAPMMAIAELSQAIARDVLTGPASSDPGWEAFAMVVELSDGRLATTAYRYGPSAERPVPTREPDSVDGFWGLREQTRGDDGQAWDVAIVKIHRASSRVVVDFVSGPDADGWRVHPDNIAQLPERLRPSAADFVGTSGQPAERPAENPAGRAIEEPPEAWTSPLVNEVHADGGIRLTNRSGATGLASLDVTREWIAEAHRGGAPVQLRGALTAPDATAVVDEVRRLAPGVDEAPSTPAPWADGYSSLQAAARNGLTDQVVDLLARGAAPTVGRGRHTPYRLAMQHGHAPVVAALLAAGAPIARGLEPPSALPDSVVLRAYPPAWIWWLLAPFVALSVLAAVDGVYALVPFFLALPLLGIGFTHLVLGNTKCAFDGPLVARRRGRGWQGPIDVRTLDAVGYAPPGGPRAPVLWFLGQRTDGDKPNLYSRRAFAKAQDQELRAIDGLRFVPLFAGRGFLSPGIQQLLVRHVDPSTVIVGPAARPLLWPDR